MLAKAWERVNDVSAKPLTAVIALAFCVAWFAISLASHGRFDPGVTVGGYVENSIQLVLLFVAASIGASSALAAERHTIAIQAKLDAIILALPHASNTLVAIDDADDAAAIGEARAELKRAATG